MNKKKFFTVILSFLLIFAVFIPVVSYADKNEYQGNLEDTVRSFQKDYFMGVFHKNIQDGRDFSDLSGEKEKARKDLNYKILTGTENGNYSLYDRFGSNVTFPLYLGEKVVKTGAADKIYTAIINVTENKLNFNSAKELIEKDPTTYANKYYQNRPPLKNTGNDPRVDRYNNLGGTTIVEDVRLAFANWLLSFSKGITSICCLLVSDQLTKAGFDIIKGFITSVSWSGIADIIRAIIPVLTILAIIYVVRKAYPVATGKYSTRNFAQNMISAAISLGMIVFLLADPASFMDVAKSITTIGDKIGQTVINASYEDDEIIHSDSLDNVVQAAIWEDAVFKPWVRGVFNGVDYDKLYTSQSGKPEDSIWQISPEATRAIGDVTVKTGSGEVRNWAALAYSTQSIYHIDSLGMKYKPSGDTEQDKQYWPKASMAASNKYIYSDDFRWLDASLKVGDYAEDSGSDPSVSVYENSIPYKFGAETYALQSLFMSFLLVPLIIIGWKKTIAVFNIILSFATIIGRSIMNMINPEDGQYSIASTVKSLGNSVVNYFWYCILIVMGISLYKTLATGIVLMQVFYIVLMIFVCRLKPQNYRDYASSIGNTVKSYGAGYFDSAKNLVNSIKSERGDFKDIANKVKNNVEAKNEVDQDTDEDEYFKHRSDDRERYGIPSGNISICRIKKEQYDDAMNKTNNFEDKKRYYRLKLALDDCRTNRDVAIAINRHRAIKGNTRMDEEVLEIPTDWLADASYYDDRINADYNESKATESRRITERADYKKNKYSSDKDKLSEKMKSLKDNASTLSDSEYNNRLKLLKKDIKKLNKKGKYLAAQSQLNRITGNNSGGSYIPLQTKVLIAKIILILIFIWMIVSVIFGVI